MSSYNFGRFVSVDQTSTTNEEVTREMMKKATEEAYQRRFAGAYPVDAMRVAMAKAAKEGIKGLVWSVFKEPGSTVNIENGDGEFLADVVEELLDTLDPRERFVLEHRYGFNGFSPMTYKTLGLICPRLREWDYEKNRGGPQLKYEEGVVGLSVERVRQIEHKALRKLRHPSRSQRLRHFLTTRTVEAIAEEV